MTSVLGLPLALAQQRLLAQGFDVECIEFSCRKGSPGSDIRVISQRQEENKMILLYAGFQTEIEH